ncbi:hypothetical protein F5882DRAFT_390345 [Hyaloscypha sp. PMI_1271]|nr:hypothetical protein F5882DRAFT_390345 [Hyaloscypha sp. PMI_1271]
MADILAALEELEARDPKTKKKNFKPTNTKFRNPLTNQQPQRVGRTPARPTSLSPQSTDRPQTASSTNDTNLLSPNVEDNDGRLRSPSVASARRISFASTPRPPPLQRRLRIPTRTASLASGFPYDPKLVKYNISEKDWKTFSDQVVEAAELPRGASVLWRVHKRDVVNKIKKELQYDGDFKRLLNAWNKKNFRVRGFTVSVELPGPPKIRPEDTEEEKELARKEAKKFRICITPNAERSGSVYSRSSSLTRSVTGEGASLHRKESPTGSEGSAKNEDNE